jgi:hypothetical protein
MPLSRDERLVMELPARSKSRSREIVPIESFQEAEALIRGRKTKFDGRFAIRIPGIPVEQSLRWERELNEAFRECGCVLASRCGFVALCGSAVWGCVQFSNGGFTWLLFLREMLIAVVLGCVLGKVLGLSQARFHIFRIAREIRRYEGRLTAEDRYLEIGERLAGEGRRY